MFGKLGSMMSAFSNLQQQAGQIGAKMKEIQERMAAERYRGSGAGGAVTVEVNGLCQVVSCQLASNSAGTEALESGVIEATNAALKLAQEGMAAEMQQITGGLDLGTAQQMLGKLGGGQ